MFGALDLNAHVHEYYYTFPYTLLELVIAGSSVFFLFFSFVTLKSTLCLAETLFILVCWKKCWDRQRKSAVKHFVFNYADELLGVS